MSFTLPVTILKEGDRYVAYSPALDLSTSGSSFDEVHVRFGEAASLFFEEIVKKQTVTEVLEDLGWHRVDHQW